jgi:hypothetical protein
LIEILVYKKIARKIKQRLIMSEMLCISEHTRNLFGKFLSDLDDWFLGGI